MHKHLTSKVITKAGKKAKDDENEDEADDFNWSSGRSHHTDSSHDDVMSVRSGSGDDVEEESIEEDDSGKDNGDDSAKDDGSEIEDDDRKSTRDDGSGNESDGHGKALGNDGRESDDAEKTQEEGKQKETKNAEAASNSKGPAENAIQKVPIGQELPPVAAQYQPAVVVKADQNVPAQNIVHRNLAIYADAGRNYKTKKSHPKVCTPYFYLTDLKQTHWILGFIHMFCTCVAISN